MSIATQLTAPAAPTGNTTQTIAVGILSEATIEDLVVTGSNGNWYATQAGALALSSPLAVGTQLVNGTTYYTINVSASGCLSTVFAVTVTVTLSNDAFALNTFTYYPNPVVSVLNIESLDLINAIEVYNSMGQKVYSEIPNKLSHTINLENLPTATYFVKLISNTKSSVISIIKK